MRRIFWKILLVLACTIADGVVLLRLSRSIRMQRRFTATLKPVIARTALPNRCRTMLVAGKKLLQDIVKPQNLNINKRWHWRATTPYVVDQQGKDVFERNHQP